MPEITLRPHHWLETLEPFYLCSTENSFYVQFFLKWAKTLRHQSLRDVIWLDFGCGDGRKTELIYREICSIFPNLRICLIDNDATALSVANARLEHCAIKEMCSVGDVDESTVILCTAIHSLYDNQSVDDFIKLIDSNSKLRCERHIVVSCEASHSDISKSRERLKESLCNIPFSRLGHLKKYFIEKEITFSSEFGHQRLDLSKNMSCKWLAPFLIGNSESQFALRSNELRLAAEREAKSLCQTSHRRPINITDEIIVARLP